MSKTDNLEALRTALFETMRQVRAGEIDLDKARAINDIGKTLIDSAKVEVDYMRTTGADSSSGFIVSPEEPAALPPGVLGITQHRIRG